jgi:hypothetical protein
MFSFCHPEATRFSSPKDLGAPRESTVFFAVEQTAPLAHFLISNCCREGGKNDAKSSETRVVRTICRALGSVSHRLLFIGFPFPRPQLY